MQQFQNNTPSWQSHHIVIESAFKIGLVKQRIIIQKMIKQPMQLFLWGIQLEQQDLGFVAFDHTKNLIIVSLRGSANPQNWISDFSFNSVSYPKCKDCKVHLGFMEDFKSIQHKLNQAVDFLVEAYPNAQILTTGHSMGAALSMIVGIQLKLRHSDKIVVIHNIGCPRVGNPSFAHFVQNRVDKIFRVVHNRDLIVHLPPLQFGFHHPAYEILWDQAMDNYVMCNQSGQDKSCSNKFFPQYKGSDHDFYFWNLIKILKC